jgi:hypothetical protein
MTEGKFERAAISSIFTLGLIGMISLYFLLANRIDNRYDKIEMKLDHVAEQLSDVRVDLAKAQPKAETPKR